jgi:hypothetical protein
MTKESRSKERLFFCIFALAKMKLMKKCFILILALLGFCCTLSAQDVIHHKRGEDLQQYLLDSIKFVLPGYQSGIVKFKDGTFARSPLNISTIEQRIYFLNPSNEVQVLTNEDQVVYVFIDRRSFLKSRYGYVEKMETIGDVSLGAVRRVSFLETEKKGAYGAPTQTSSVTTIGSIQEGGVMYTLNVDQTTPFLYKVLPYLCKEDKILLPNKKNLIKCFPDKKETIESYLKEHSVDFESLDDMKQLFEALREDR